MALNTLQQAIRDLCTTGAAKDVLFNRPGTDETKTVHEWFSQGSAEQVNQIINDLGVGQAMGLITSNDIVQADTVRTKIFTGSEFPASMSSDVVAKLSAVIGSGVFDFQDSDLVGVVETILSQQDYPNCRAKFQSLKTRTATVNESLFDGLATDTDVQIAIGG